MKSQDTLKNRTIFITGGSRGIGLAIALRAAKDGANVIIAAKTDTPHPSLEGTIHTAAKEIEQAGGNALAIKMDLRDDENVVEAMQSAAEHFGGIDILINNASAIYLANTQEMPMKRFDLMHSVNARGTFLASQTALPFLKESDNAHILTLSPPLNMDAKWFGPHCGYTMAKYGMSMCTLGMAEEFKHHNISVNSLWPKTVIYTDALKMIGAIKEMNCRKPEIVADAAHAILTQDAKATTGNFYVDEEVLAKKGISDFSDYAYDPSADLIPDIFL